MKKRYGLFRREWGTYYVNAPPPGCPISQVVKFERMWTMDLLALKIRQVNFNLLTRKSSETLTPTRSTFESR